MQEQPTTLQRKAMRSRFYSVDQSAHWQDLTRSGRPSFLHQYVRFHLSDLKQEKVNGAEIWTYSRLPVDNANLVYVDGGFVPGRAIWADAWFLEKNAPGRLRHSA